METLVEVHAIMKQSLEAAAIFSEIVIIYKNTLTEDLKKSDLKLASYFHVLCCLQAQAGLG